MTSRRSLVQSQVRPPFFSKTYNNLRSAPLTVLFSRATRGMTKHRGDAMSGAWESWSTEAAAFIMKISQQEHSHARVQEHGVRPRRCALPPAALASWFPSKARSPSVAAAGGRRCLSNRSSISQSAAHRLRRGSLPTASAQSDLPDLNCRLVLSAGRDTPS